MKDREDDIIRRITKDLNMCLDNESLEYEQVKTIINNYF